MLASLLILDVHRLREFHLLDVIPLRDTTVPGDIHSERSTADALLGLRALALGANTFAPWDLKRLYVLHECRLMSVFEISKAKLAFEVETPGEELPVF